MAWCLLKEFADKFRKGLKDGSISPEKLSAMSSAERRAFLEGYVGKENAANVNALFESKLLLKNQQAGMVSWAKRVAGITEARRSDLISRIERLTEVLDPVSGEQFLNDLVNARLKIEVTQEEAKVIADLSKKITETKEKANKEGVFPSEQERLEYGAAKVSMENYVNELKLSARKVTFKEAPVRKMAQTITDTIPSLSKSVLASMDNSFWGRQGIKVLLNTRTANVWTKNFVKSWGDIGKTLGGIEVMDVIKADIYSRPNAVLGKYKVGGYGLDVLSEEAFPSSLPERIPAFGRLFKASEVAYNGAALRLRADLADRYIALAEKQGINTLDPEQAKGIGHLVGSLTGRGSLGEVTPQTAQKLNVLFFSAKFLKSNFDILTAHQFDKKATPFAKKQAAKNLANITLTLASVMFLAKLLDPDSVDEDPRSTNFGKVKIFGHWVDITGGMASLATLAARLVPTQHDGEFGWWYKSQAGNWIKLNTGKYGSMTAWDVFGSFFAGKLSPAAGVLRDIWKGEDFQGNPLTVSGVTKNAFIPLPVQNINALRQDPNTSWLLGSIILDQLGFSTSTSIIPNRSSNLIPENVKVDNDDIISYVHTYARALDVDPVTAFNRIFTGQKIVRVTGNTVVVERIPVDESQAIKEERGGKNPEMKLDHTIPLQLGGSNDKDNLKLVTTAEWRSYTPIENALGKALKEGKITKKEAQKMILDFKEGKINKDQIMRNLE
jgi:hypothetical protein